jgi:ABC-type Fe3+ transport system permease subunit
MGWLRGVGRWAGVGLGGVLLAWLVALGPAAMLDRGPGGDVRPSLLPAALVVLDPFVWDCARNSVVVAAVVAAGSLILGLALARVVVGWQFWGRLPLAAMAFAPLVVPPLFGAIGLRVMLGKAVVGPGGGLSGWVPWLAWAWVGLAGGVPLVAMRTATILARVEPAWADAARLVGVSPRRVWRKFVWRVVRPDVARAAGTVFALTLVEPGAPLVLGLRRTLAFQIVEAAARPDPAPRAAVLALMALGLAAVGRVLVGWWGGPADLPISTAPVARAEPAGRRLALGFIAGLGVVVVLACLPIAALLAAALGRPSGSGFSPASFAHRLGSEDARRLAANSIMLGVSAVAIDLVLARLMMGENGRRRRPARALALWAETVPPLIVGVGALMVPVVLQFGADALRAAGSREAVAKGLQAMADGLDPFRTPGVLLVLGVAAVRLPLVVRAVEASHGASRRAMIEAAIVLGATPSRARRLASGGPLGASRGALALSAALAATSLAPSLVLATTSESRPVAPGVLILADEPGEGRRRAAALASCALAANVAAFAMAARSRPGPIGDWLRAGP